MVFSSLSFLLVFLPMLAVLYFVIPAKWKNVRQYLLLAFSLAFYGSGEPLYIFLIIWRFFYSPDFRGGIINPIYYMCK